MPSRTLILPAAALALNIATAVECHSAAVDYFLKLDGIEGESTDKQYKGEFELASFSWGVSNSGPVLVGSGAGSGKPELSALKVTLPLSKATPTLFVKCASGVHIKSGVLTIRKAGEPNGDKSSAPVELLTITLTNIVISSMNEAGGGGALPTDAMSLNFAKASIQVPTPVTDPPPIGTTGGDIASGQ